MNRYCCLILLLSAAISLNVSALDELLSARCQAKCLRNFEQSAEVSAGGCVFMSALVKTEHLSHCYVCAGFWLLGAFMSDWSSCSVRIEGAAGDDIKNRSASSCCKSSVLPVKRTDFNYELIAWANPKAADFYDAPKADT